MTTVHRSPAPFRAASAPLEAMVQTHRALGSATRAQLLAHLRSAGEPQSVQRLAAASGLHPNSVRDQLEPLLAVGLVERRLAPPDGRGRPGYRYALSRRPDAGPDGSAGAPEERAYRTLAAALADQLAGRPDGRLEAEAAGGRWGRTLARSLPEAPTASAAVGALVALLDQSGFAPESSLAADGSLALHRCPFAAIVGDRREIVCGVHLGLMRGALEGLAAPLRAGRLEPFVRPDLCLAHLAPAADA